MGSNKIKEFRSYHRCRSVNRSSVMRTLSMRASSRRKLSAFLTLAWLIAWIGVGFSHDFWHLAHLEGKSSNACVICRTANQPMVAVPEAGKELLSPPLYQIEQEIGADSAPRISRELGASSIPRGPPPLLLLLLS